jgi:hypothetical protein
MSAGRRYELTYSAFRKSKYFCGEDWTGQISLKSLAEIAVRRTQIREPKLGRATPSKKNRQLIGATPCGSSQ